ncbi:ATP-binding protein [Clostridium thermopalmarium]|uniref:Uncharacterized protein n=1 Tax=Clostridium thermopalmarium DSM 5974 TaxID=1121340 RepID=A0A2T0AZM5_9CLOT|nr:hypothetical protein [Clostridium thermopalmarium]PRR76675.1 hypothetical protein CPAL_00600 [Clostridium thermopalmarium DSM 5974]PVZ23010.1 hypothetical protein LX19_01664 [Clostridium thermopalmarium DSM 5974]
MNSFKRENFFVEINNELLKFYRKDEEVFLVKYKDREIVEEKPILNNCYYLNNVILTKDNNISIIFTNKTGNLILCTMFEEKISNKITLMKSLLNTKYIEVASVNNSLNIFYVTYNSNNTAVLCFRILNNRLVLSPPLILDTINIKGDFPFIVSVNNNQLSVCYIKNSYPNLIGYRKFDCKKNSWSNFYLLDSSYYEIEDYCFATLNDTIAYAFTFFKNENWYIRFGFGDNDDIKRDMIEERNQSIYGSNIILYSNDKMNVEYIANNTIKLKEMNLFKKTRNISELNLIKVLDIEKYPFQSDNKISTNFIIIVICDEKIIYTDSCFYEEYLNNRNREHISPNKSLDERLLAIEQEDIYNKILNEDIRSNILQEKIIKELTARLKQYEERFKIVSMRSRQSDKEKNKLRLNIASLHEEMTKRYNRINVLEKALGEKQSLIASYENKIKELKDSMKELEARKYELEEKEAEVLELKQIVAQSNAEKINYLNETKELRNQIDNLNNILKDKTEEVENLKNQFAALKEKNNESFIKKLFKITD